MALTRVTITLPAELVRAADRAAKAQDRSRSRIIADAVRRALAPVTPAGERPPAVRETASGPYAAPPDAAAFAAARQQHLAADLALTPAERAHRADDLADLARLARSPSARRAREQVLAFDSYAEFAAWKTVRRMGG